ncbi:MAG: 4Fe-4S dicluster domain-containing protein [Aquificae bacterium]|nr:4Fe-4S dicluster domain-containing protein [Aquificota bacterium]
MSETAPFLKGCNGCGACTAVCPPALFINFSPRRLVESLLEPDEEVLNELLTRLVWACSLCFACSSVCPLGTDPARLVLYLRRLAYERGKAQQAVKACSQLLGGES